MLFLAELNLLTISLSGDIWKNMEWFRKTAPRNDKFSDPFLMPKN